MPANTIGATVQGCIEDAFTGPREWTPTPSIQLGNSGAWHSKDGMEVPVGRASEAMTEWAVDNVWHPTPSSEPAWLWTGTISHIKTPGEPVTQALASGGGLGRLWVNGGAWKEDDGAEAGFISRGTPCVGTRRSIAAGNRKPALRADPRMIAGASREIRRGNWRLRSPVGNPPSPLKCPG